MSEEPKKDQGLGVGGAITLGALALVAAPGLIAGAVFVLPFVAVGTLIFGSKSDD